MKKERSPSYPALSLRVASLKITEAYKLAKRHKTDRRGMVQALGYSGTSGKSLSVLSALKAYGLLEGKKGEFSISTDGETIAIYPKSSKERKEALNRCSTAPQIFSKILEDHNGEFPSDELLKPYLLKSSFSFDASNRLIQSLRDTIAFLEEEKIGFSASKIEDINNENNDINKDTNTILDTEPLKTDNNPIIEDKNIEIKQDVFTLDEGKAVIQWPAHLSQDSFDEFDSWLKLVVGKAKRSISGQEKADVLLQDESKGHDKS